MTLIFNYLISVSDSKIAVGELFTGWGYKRNLTVFFHLGNNNDRMNIRGYISL